MTDEPKPCQKSYHFLSLAKISRKFIHNFSSIPTEGQTEQSTKT